MTPATDNPADAPKLLYRLVFSGELLPGFDEAQVRSALTRRLQRSPASLFGGKRVTVGEYADPQQAETERQALQALGARIQVEEVEAPPPMPALGFLEVALPAAPAAEPQTTEKFAKTDSGWQSLGDGPAPLPPVDDDLLRSLEPARTEPKLETPDVLPRSTGLSPGSSVSNASARPPTDLSAVFSTSTATPAPVVEASPVFAPVGKPPVTSLADPRSTTETAAPSALAVPATMAIAEPTRTQVQTEVPGADWINCPACGERQPMRLLCRACGADLKRALAAQQEERAQNRAAGVVRGGAATKTKSVDAPMQDDNPRVLGFRVPDEWVARLTWPNVLLALFGFLLVLTAIGFLWRMLGLDPIFSSSSKPAPVVVAPAVSDTAPALSAPGADNAAPGVGPAPPEAEVAARLPSAAAVAEFRLRYWQQPTSKVFVYSSGGAMAWRGGSTSVTRAIAEAINECENRRPAAAPPCKLVNVNNYWQD
ncbi:MAG: hypothetical protein RIS44_1103 [Pseudomonadota bacterium]|jgi:hypothetical protein